VEVGRFRLGRSVLDLPWSSPDAPPGPDQARMPLPNYGHSNKETVQHQDLVFEMPPEIVSDEEEFSVINGKKVKRKRGKITTGKLGIDVERKLVINAEKDKDIWTREVDPRDIEDARKFSSPERQVLKKNVRSELDSLISGDKARSIKSTRRPSLSDSPPPSSDYNKSVRFNLPAGNKHMEQSVTGISIQPSGTYVQPHGSIINPRSWTTLQPSATTYRQTTAQVSRTSYSSSAHGVRGLN